MAYKKYFTLSFDDGLEQDKQIIRILKEFELNCCTFNLNAGLLGERRALGRLGNAGFYESMNTDLIGKRKGIFHYVPDHRIPADEIAQVYDGFEIASHGFRHENVRKIAGEELENSISEDVQTLRRLSNQPVTGFAYPYGAISDKAIHVLRSKGIRYARTTKSTNSFMFPDDSYKINPSCWIIQRNLFDLTQKFIDTEPTKQDQLLFIWGHGYEFDFGTDRNNWESFRRLCEKIAMAKNIICGSNAEVLLLKHSERDL